MDSLYRFEARFTALDPIGVVPDGLRLDAHFEGRVVEGRLAGATVTGSTTCASAPMASACSTCA